MSATYQTKDSGERSQFETGALRDTADGKGRYDLIPGDALKRIAQLYERGAKKYNDRNWEKGIPASRCMDSMLRHAHQASEALALCQNGDANEDPEDHLAAVCFNAMALMAYEERGMIDRFIGVTPEEDLEPEDHEEEEEGEDIVVGGEVTVQAAIEHGGHVELPDENDCQCGCSPPEECPPGIFTSPPNTFKVGDVTHKSYDPPSNKVEEIFDRFVKAPRHRRTVVYISGPITNGGGPVDIQAIGSAVSVGLDLIKEGYSVIMPQLTAFCQKALADAGIVWDPHGVNCGLSHYQWLSVDYALVDICDVVLRMPGQSKGADMEVTHATMFGKPVHYDHMTLRDEVPTMMECDD